MKYLCLGCAGSRQADPTIARFRDGSVGAFAVESVEMTVLDLRLDYPEPEVLAKMPLKKELVS